jgi:23S rRNA pseudouridine1911/1915/1917 synthase
MSEPLLPRGVYRLEVATEQLSPRLDQLLCGALPWLSRGAAKRLIDLGGVHVDGRRVRRCSLPLHSGQRIELHVDGLPLTPFQLSDAHLLYRDAYLLVIDKPAGIATQPTPARFQGTLYAAALNLLGRAGDADLGMVQRLDRDTSGVLVFSIHPRAHKGLTAAFTEHRVDKRYLALVAGAPPQRAGEIRSLLARRHATNRVVSVARGGKPAITRYRVLESFAEASLVEVELLTGRSHQIRAHFAEAGCPLVGDIFYGGPATCIGVPVSRQMLHANELRLDHPVTGEPCHWQARLPEDFAALLERLRTCSAATFSSCSGL